jgi:ferredoxin
MAAPIVLVLAAVCLAAAVFLTIFGLLQIGSGRGRRETASPLPVAALAATEAPQPAQSWVHLDQHPALQAEPGVLLNTLWEHLTTAECQQGECGGCRLRLLDGQVRWIREPQVEIDRSTHILACSCEPLGTVRCARA